MKGWDAWLTNGRVCRSCVGRNLANLELLVIVASIFRRYEFVLEDPTAEVRPVVFFFSGVWC